MWILEKYFEARTGNVPYYARYSLAKIMWIPLRKVMNVVIIPNIPFSSWRIGLYRMLGYKIGKNVFIGMKCYLDDTEPSSFTVGDNSIISYGCYFALHGKGQNRSTITLEDGVYIGTRSTIIAGEAGLTIGSGATVGAGSLVNKPVEPGSIVGGNPARLLRSEKSSG
ncbi:MAG: acyltransferase [Rhodothermales bacterium]|nr:acyltransferase [Rhodothermales bacterium]